jgi:hypothetical protein
MYGKAVCGRTMILPSLLLMYLYNKVVTGFTGTALVLKLL